MLMSLEKRFALKLVKHAASVLPKGLSSWGSAMLHEIEYIHSDREALRWAVGCVSASYLQRIASFNVVQTSIIRWALAVFIASWAVDGFFSVRLFYLKVAGWLGLGAQAGTYLRSIPWLEVMPAWTFALDGVAGLFYVAAAYGLARKKVSSVSVLLAGAVLGGTACASQVVAALREYGHVLSPENLRWSCFMFAVQLCVVLMLWQGFGRIREQGAGGDDPKA